MEAAAQARRARIGPWPRRPARSTRSARPARVAAAAVAARAAIAPRPDSNLGALWSAHANTASMARAAHCPAAWPTDLGRVLTCMSRPPLGGSIGGDGDIGCCRGRGCRRRAERGHHPHQAHRVPRQGRLRRHGQERHQERQRTPSRTASGAERCWTLVATSGLTGPLRLYRRYIDVAPSIGDSSFCLGKCMLACANCQNFLNASRLSALAAVRYSPRGGRRKKSPPKRTRLGFHCVT